MEAKPIVKMLNNDLMRTIHRVSIPAFKSLLLNNIMSTNDHNLLCYMALPSFDIIQARYDARMRTEQIQNFLLLNYDTIELPLV